MSPGFHIKSALEPPLRSGRHVLTLHFTVRMEGDGGISDTAVAVDQQFRHSADKVDVVGKSFMSHEQTFAIGYIGRVATVGLMPSGPRQVLHLVEEVEENGFTGKQALVRHIVGISQYDLYAVVEMSGHSGKPMRRTRTAVRLGQQQPFVLGGLDTDGQRQAFMADMACTGRGEGMMQVGVFQFQGFQYVFRVVGRCVIHHDNFETLVFLFQYPGKVAA